MLPAVCFLLARHACSGVTIMIMRGRGYDLYIKVMIAYSYYTL